MPSPPRHELSLSNFQLRPNSYGTDLRDRADALPLVKATVTAIMNDLNRRDDDTPVTVSGACEPNAVQAGSSVPIVRSACFNDGDNATAQWYPQASPRSPTCRLTRNGATATSPS